MKKVTMAIVSSAIALMPGLTAVRPLPTPAAALQQGGADGRQDRLRPDIAYVMKERHVSAAEASRLIKAQDVFSLRADRVAQLYPDQFVAARWTEQGGVIWVHQKRPGMEAVAKDTTLHDVAARPLTQRHADTAQIARLVGDSTATGFTVYVDPLTEDVEVELGAEGAGLAADNSVAEDIVEVKSRVSRFAAYHGLGAVTVSASSGENVQEAIYGGGVWNGSAGTCTGGFPAMMNGLPAISVAGHCGPTSVYGGLPYSPGYTSQWRRSPSGSGDLAVMRISGDTLTNQISFRNWPDDPSFTFLRIISAVGTPPLNKDVCMWGRASSGVRHHHESGNMFTDKDRDCPYVQLDANQPGYLDGGGLGRTLVYL